jgi:hypothetical protein
MSSLPTLSPSTEEVGRRHSVMSHILECIRQGRTIRLPDFDSGRPRLEDVENDFSGTVGLFRYQFEGEEDLLHLTVTRADGSAIAVGEGQAVAAFVLRGVPPALIRMKPGEFSQHFYFGHEDLIGNLAMG